MCVAFVNNEKGHLVPACLTSAPRTENRMVVESRVRALEAGGEDRSPRGTLLEDCPEPPSRRQSLLGLASAARLSSCSWPAPSPKSCAARAIEGGVGADPALQADQDINRTIPSITFSHSSPSVE
jgi:hypothetical protein